MVGTEATQYPFEEKRTYSWKKNILHAGLNVCFLAALYFCSRKKVIATLYAAYWSMPLVSMLAAYFSPNEKILYEHFLNAKTVVKNFDNYWTMHGGFVSLIQQLDQLLPQKDKSLKETYPRITVDISAKSDERKLEYILEIQTQIQKFGENEYSKVKQFFNDSEYKKFENQFSPLENVNQKGNCILKWLLRGCMQNGIQQVLKEKSFTGTDRFFNQLEQLTNLNLQVKSNDKIFDHYEKLTQLLELHHTLSSSEALSRIELAINNYETTEDTATNIKQGFGEEYLKASQDSAKKLLENTQYKKEMQERINYCIGNLESIKANLKHLWKTFREKGKDISLFPIPELQLLLGASNEEEFDQDFDNWFEVDLVNKLKNLDQINTQSLNEKEIQFLEGGMSAVYLWINVLNRIFPKDFTEVNQPFFVFQLPIEFVTNKLHGFLMPFFNQKELLEKSNLINQTHQDILNKKIEGTVLEIVSEISKGLPDPLYLYFDFFFSLLASNITQLDQLQEHLAQTPEQIEQLKMLQQDPRQLLDEIKKLKMIQKNPEMLQTVMQMQIEMFEMRSSNSESKEKIEELKMIQKNPEMITQLIEGMEKLVSIQKSGKGNLTQNLLQANLNALLQETISDPIIQKMLQQHNYTNENMIEIQNNLCDFICQNERKEVLENIILYITKSPYWLLFDHSKTSYKKILLQCLIAYNLINLNGPTNKDTISDMISTTEAKLNIELEVEEKNCFIDKMIKLTPSKKTLLSIEKQVANDQQVLEKIEAFNKEAGKLATNALEDDLFYILLSKGAFYKEDIIFVRKVKEDLGITNNELFELLWDQKSNSAKEIEFSNQFLPITLEGIDKIHARRESKILGFIHLMLAFANSKKSYPSGYMSKLAQDTTDPFHQCLIYGYNGLMFIQWVLKQFNIQDDKGELKQLREHCSKKDEFDTKFIAVYRELKDKAPNLETLKTQLSLKLIPELSIEAPD
jgi:hypothetical protein